MRNSPTGYSGRSATKPLPAIDDGNRRMSDNRHPAARTMEAESAPRADYSLPRARILRGRQEFARLFNEGEGVRTGKLLVKFLRMESGTGGLTAGFIVRRSAGGAVVRNRVRRSLREAYRLERPAFESSLPRGLQLHIAFLWLGNAAASSRVSYDEIDNEVHGALRKLSRRLRGGPDESTRR